MGLLKEATLQNAFAKIGLFGMEGSGKTYTAATIAIGLAKMVKQKRVAFFDTEGGSDFLIPLFKKEEITLLVFKGRSFRDLIGFIKEVQQEKIEIAITDSVTHVWRELCEAYKEKKKKDEMNIRDWGLVKGQWWQFTDLYVTSRIHFIVCGRAGYEYEMNENDNGKKEMMKSGTKMKTEGEFGFEPSLLIEMIKVPLAEIEKNKKVKGHLNRAVIIKDRSDLINGRMFDNPKFKDFLPHIKFLNIGGEHYAYDQGANSKEIFEDKDWSYEERKKKKEILLETIANELIKLGLNGRSDQVQRDKIMLLEDIFGTSSSTEIANLPLNDLDNSVRTLVMYRQEKETSLKVPAIPDGI